MNSVARGIAHGLAIVLFDEMRPNPARTYVSHQR
jgi:hypothetical protein